MTVLQETPDENIDITLSGPSFVEHNELDRHPWLIRLKHYFSPEGSLSIYLLIGFLILVLGSKIFSEIASNVSANESIVRFDMAVETAIHANTNPGLIELMFLATLAGSVVIIIAAIALGIFFVWRRNWRDLLLLVVAVCGEEIVNLIFKNTFNRPRPIFTDPIAIASDFSFPSGHAMASMVFYGLIAYFLMRHSKPIIERILIAIIGVIIVSIIGFSRIYLGLHYPSDVLAGYSAGLAWLAFAISGLGLYRRWRKYRHEQRNQYHSVIVK
jgi:undecaprenyl-diphosphatase